jgi:hypothetical protein
VADLSPAIWEKILSLLQHKLEKPALNPSPSPSPQPILQSKQEADVCEKVHKWDVEAEKWCHEVSKLQKENAGLLAKINEFEKRVRVIEDTNRDSNQKHIIGTPQKFSCRDEAGRSQ